MNSKTPKVSIGLPVFNGEKYLRTALDSILSQTYKDFELIISDNASTDGTRQICLEYMGKDNRIRYYRNKTNLGAARNFNRVFGLSSGEYFKWANCDDVHAQDYLSRCVDALDNDPTAVFCHSKVGRINERGELIGEYDLSLKVNSQKPHERFASLIRLANNGWILIHGLMRTSALRKTQRFGSYISADRNLLAEISLRGRMIQVPETLFFRREHSESYTERNYSSLYEKLSWWTTTNPKRLVFPYWRVCFEYIKSIRHAGLKWFDRQLCYAQIGKWLLQEGWVLMSSDIAYNVFTKLHLQRQLRPISNYLLKPFSPK
jgi:glycosyltransferase involved in cell wall biosynthesis